MERCMFLPGVLRGVVGAVSLVFSFPPALFVGIPLSPKPD
jgi:hypothetical protein